MKKRNYLISLLAVVLSLGVLVGCGDKTNTSNEGASVNSSENSEAASSKDSSDVAKDKGEADKAQAKDADSKDKEATNKDEGEKKEEDSKNDSSTKETAKVDNSNKKESKGSSNSSKKEESKSASKKENSKDESSLAKSEYLQKMKKIDSESEKLDKEYDSNRGSTQAGMNGISGEQAKLYDNELNQIYDYLKQNLSKEKAKELEKSEMAWIKEKESNIAEIRKQYEGGSITPLMVNSEVAKESKERCYYLIDNYMK
ncbi:MAG: lysozyme inhibitor LprI family protein [Clostridium perfringens]|uniref:lysozyme inhibitor LprI family protein n=1 Tax=Clostridium perfringens TaxID=1502 RepID=UPI001CB4A950|nr:lysozyme inhibitor LprI family protein [Clostridium perfringens]STB11422.1 lipoprotein [Clostridium novyi]MDK0743776.1 lysozyme inhibitor LprI family protein [Clostridium perfringens]MDK0752227.1 lysozyme inhibitor LprI family protein [Clostridium perfringens]MDK0755416.1 lysozyme inhibitor LprI family protein [Clostridium perfringens]MDK0895741.1 lysozyme inhibitor LprI family protein [Clostridium perfringens]